MQPMRQYLPSRRLELRGKIATYSKESHAE